MISIFPIRISFLPNKEFGYSDKFSLKVSQTCNLNCLSISVWRKHRIFSLLIYLKLGSTCFALVHIVYYLFINENRRYRKLFPFFNFFLSHLRVLFTREYGNSTFVRGVSSLFETFFICLIRCCYRRCFLFICIIETIFIIFDRVYVHNALGMDF